MNEKIRIYLQYPWKFPDSPYYKYLLNNLPPGIEFVNQQKEKYNVISSSHKRFLFLNSLKNVLRVILYFLAIPNITKTKSILIKNVDLIHCAHCLSKNKKPWVVDLEHYWNFASSAELANSYVGKKKIKNLLKNKYCKKIIAWTYDCKNAIINSLQDKEIERKVEVVYPALPERKFKKIKNKKITLLFAGRYFYPKGGHHVLKVFDILTKKYDNVEAIFISEVPKEILKKYSQNKKINFLGLIPQERLFNEIYPNSDIFVYPGYSDTFGFAIPEAMSFGLPVVSVTGFGRKELIEDGETGFVINNKKIKWKGDIPLIKEQKEIIHNLVKKTSELIENKRLLKKMSENAKKLFKKGGKFSINIRNEKLLKIYQDAVL